jgi:hypothetical protein
MKSMLSRKQQLLISFQRRLVIETTDSDGQSGDDVDTIFLNNLGSKNPRNRLFVLSKTNSLLQ